MADREALAKNIALSDSRPGRQAGLTLIELLVAISILSFIAILGWRGLDSIVRARAAITSDLEQTRGMQITFAQLQSDCANLASPTLLPERMPILVEDGRLSLVRTVFADDHPTRLQVVTYRIKDGTLTRLELAATRDLSMIDALWKTAADAQDGTPAITLLSGVSDLNMRLWIDRETSWRTGTEVAQLATVMTSVVKVPQGASSFKLPPLTGLEVALRLQGRNDRLVKIFLLGAV